MKKAIKKQSVTQDEFEPIMTAVQQQFNRIDDRLVEHDKRFDEIDKKLTEHDKRFDRLERITETTLEIVQSIDARLKEDRVHRLPERVEALEDDVLKIKVRLA